MGMIAEAKSGIALADKGHAATATRASDPRAGSAVLFLLV